MYFYYDNCVQLYLDTILAKQQPSISNMDGLKIKETL